MYVNVHVLLCVCMHICACTCGSQKKIMVSLPGFVWSCEVLQEKLLKDSVQRFL